MNILVTGGTGYVGSHIVKKLVEDNYKVVVYDNLSLGNQNAVNKKAIFIKSDLNDKIEISKVLKKYKINAVFLMAAYSSISESINNPKKYFKNNVDNSINLLNAMKNNKVRFIVFASSSSIYGMELKYHLQRKFTKWLKTPMEKLNLFLKIS